MADIDSQTVADLKRGNDGAYIRVVKALKDQIFRFALRLCRDRDTAEDITQQTFLAVWESISSFQGRSRFSTWVFAIAYRQYLTVRRWEMRSPDTVPLEEWRQSDDALDPSGLVVRADQSDRLHRAVYALPDPYRETICLVHLEELTCREAAEVLGVPVGTVKSRINGALGMLRERLQESEVMNNE